MTVSCLLLACAAKEAPQGVERLDGVTVVTGGPGTGTDMRSVMFKGWVSYRDNGRVVPLSNVTFTRYEKLDEAPTILAILVDNDGRFEAELFLVTTVTGHRKVKRGTTVVLDSPGCSSMELQVNDDWRPRTLELACEFR